MIKLCEERNIIDAINSCPFLEEIAIKNVIDSLDKDIWKYLGKKYFGYYKDDYCFFFKVEDCFTGLDDERQLLRLLSIGKNGKLIFVFGVV